MLYCPILDTVAEKVVADVWHIKVKMINYETGLQCYLSCTH